MRYTTRIEKERIAVDDTICKRKVRTFKKASEALAYSQGLAMYDALAFMVSEVTAMHPKAAHLPSVRQAKGTLAAAELFNDEAYDRSAATRELVLKQLSWRV